MQRPRAKSRRGREPGFIITLVAVFMLFVVGAMAALSIDVVTFYTARSEAQLAADSAALAGARVLANSGTTSSTDGDLADSAVALCGTVAKQVGESNQVAGQNINSSQITVTCDSTKQSNPTVRAQVQVTVPAFFARIWGTRQVTVTAAATAEAYNPSGFANNLTTPQPAPVAPSCVKPWLLPNIDPLNTSQGIFNPATGAIIDASLLGSQQSGLLVNCPPAGCTPPNGPAPWSYYPGDTSPSGDFPAPPPNSVSCSPPTTGFKPTAYQLAIAGCVQAPIACNATNVRIDLNLYAGRDVDTISAVNCLSHSATNAGDKIDPTTFPAGPFRFLAGDENPLVAAGLASRSQVLVSDSLVTVPVFDNSAYAGGNTVNLVGFVQLFLNPDGNAAPSGGPLSAIINMVGCGANSSATAVYGNGATAVAVRLITHP